MGKKKTQKIPSSTHIYTSIKEKASRVIEGNTVNWFLLWSKRYFTISRFKGLTSRDSTSHFD